MKKISILFFIIVSLFFSVNNVFAVEDIGSASGPGYSENTTIKNGIVDSIGSGNKFINVKGEKGVSIISSLFQWFKGEISSVVMVLAVGVFIFIGIRLASSRGNPEEFKKSLLHLVYTVLGIFLIFMAWGLVKLVSSLSL